MSDTALWWPDLTAGPRESAADEQAHAGRVLLLSAMREGDTVFTLSRIEQLLLWSARRWRHGRFRWDQVEMEFRGLLPGGWADALIAWEEAMDQLHLYPSGRPDIGNGCRSVLSLDERALLTLVAVMQRGTKARLSASLLLAHLMPAARRRDLAGPLLALAGTLSLAGLELPLRCSPLPTETGISARSANS